MELKKIALGVALAAGTMAAQAEEVVFFPYVVNSPAVTTIVSVIDSSAANTAYDASGNAGGNRLHWRLNYKTVDSNAAACEEINYYLPSSPNDIQTVDLGAKFGASTSGVLFNDASVNNNWRAGVGGLTYALAERAGAQARGILFVHNADNAGGALAGDALVLDFTTGAAWGYAGIANAAAGAAAFNFGGLPAANSNAVNPAAVSFMPFSEVTTRLFVTPLNDAGAAVASASMLGANGANVVGWDRFTVNVGLVTNATGVAFDRDENLVSGSLTTNVTCVGAVDVGTLMTAGARATLANGGYGQLALAEGPTAPAGVGTTTMGVGTAHVVKLEFSTAGTLNGQAIPGTFNNAFKLP